MRRALAVASLFALAACGSGTTTGADGGVADLATVASPDLTPTSTAGPNDIDTTLTPFTLQPTDELIKCQYFPADGIERELSAFNTDMSAGSHHLVVFRIDETKGKPTGYVGTELQTCSQIEIPAGFDGMLPGSQQEHTAFNLPTGVAMRMTRTHGLLFQMHYINATQQPITTSVHWTAKSVDPASVKAQAGMIFYSNFQLNIPTGTSTATATCPSPTDRNLMTATGHMHVHGTQFDATVAGQNVFHTTLWSEPNGNVFAQPGFAVKKGDPISWTCAYNNQTGGPLKFGNSATKNEMCIFVSLFYPAATPAQEFDFGCAL